MSEALKNSPNARLNKLILDRFNRLPLPENITIATYIWICEDLYTVRSKERTLNFYPKQLSDVPVWQHGTIRRAGDGSSDVYIRPVAMFKDPFKPGNNILVFCDAYEYNGKPTNFNKRLLCLDVVNKCLEEEPWFGFEQEYTLLDMDRRPFGWPTNGFPGPVGPNFCGVGAENVNGRDVAEAHYRACLYAGIKICGINAEGLLSQWEYQIGPCVGISVCDELWVSRFILLRVAEEFGVSVTFDPKPVPGNWYGSGAHCNVSTQKMRADGGIKEIEKAIEKLSLRHEAHMRAYDLHEGQDNARRLNGTLETSQMNEFSAAISERYSSIRIPRIVADDGKGYFEDRRPSSNCDPYSVVEIILRTICLDE